MGTKCQGDTLIPKSIVHMVITLSYNNINYWLGIKEDVHLWVQSIQCDMKELFLLEKMVFFCILISGVSADSCLLFCIVINYICAKNGLDCPVVTLHLSGSLPRLNKSHMQILMEVFRPFISHILAEGKRSGWCLFRKTCFQTRKRDFNTIESKVFN